MPWKRGKSRTTGAQTDGSGFGWDLKMDGGHGGLGEMSLHSHAHTELAPPPQLHSRDLSAAYPRPLSLEAEHRPMAPAFDHSLSALGYSGDPPSSSGSTYTTLTPLQPPLQPFDHHHHHHHPCLPVSNVIGSFTLMREDRSLGGANFYNAYGKELGVSQSLPPPSGGAGLGTAVHGYGGGSGANGGQMIHGGYDLHAGNLFCRTADFGRDMSPPGLGGGASDASVGHQLNKMEAHQHPPAHHPHIYSPRFDSNKFY